MREVRDSDAAGGLTTLARSETADGHDVLATTAEGRSTRYTAEELTNGDRHRATTDATDGITLSW